MEITKEIIGSVVLYKATYKVEGGVLLARGGSRLEVINVLLKDIFRNK